MTGWLLDTNVVSELGKRRADPHVTAWSNHIDPADLWLSVLVFGEIRCGIVRLIERDARRAQALQQWIAGLERTYENRILSVDGRIAMQWGDWHADHRLPIIDGLLAATAFVHDLTLVTRNTKDVARTGIACLDPFKA